MKISRILMFMWSIMLGLVLVSIVMPTDGLTVCGKTLDFPSLASVMGAGEPEEPLEPEQLLSPEELLEMRMAALQTQKEDEFRQFTQYSPSRIHLPHADETYLDKFFESLENAGEKAVRVLHYGDSQLECDRISCTIREHYQEEFGGQGVGLVPALQTVATYTTSQTITADTVYHYLAYGPAGARADHKRYGPMAQVNHVLPGTTITLSPRSTKNYPHSGKVRRITILAKGSGGMTVSCLSQSFHPEETEINDNFSRMEVRLPSGANSITITAHGDYDIYGIQLDDLTGVAVDNIPMRGCSGTIFTGIDQSTLTPFFQHENIGLIMLQYGGNSVPNATKESTISSYMTSLRRQIRLFRKLAPEAAIMFIGPADMATSIKGEIQTYPGLPQMVDSLRAMSLQEGIAFWDMFSAMGGRGSIVKWNTSSPQLAGSDYIHFTTKGAQKMADMLYETMNLYYRFYRLRTGKESDAIRRESQPESADTAGLLNVPGINTQEQ